MTDERTGSQGPEPSMLRCRPVRPLRFWPLLGLGLAACGGTSHAVTDPAATVRAFAEASRSGDVSAVYALLDDATRERLTLAELQASFASNPAEARAQSERLAHVEAVPATRAKVELPSGEELPLVLEEGGFHLAGGFLDAASPATPEDAVTALRHALLRRSLPALLRILSRNTRAELEAELQRLLDETEDELDLDVQTSEDRATVQLGGGRVLELDRVAGEWRIVDVH
jgi:hypothetical protein